MLPRSYLYVPGDQAQMLAKAADRGADALIVDLEDSVVPANKDLARRNLVTLLDEMASPGVARAMPDIWVRVNNHPDLLSPDLAAANHPHVAGVSLPKSAEPSTIAMVRAQLSSSLGLIPLIESAEGLMQARDIAREEGVSRLALGEADLAADLGVEPTSPTLEAARIQIILASAAAGLPKPIAPVSTDTVDLDALEVDNRRMRSLGFGARSAIHPAQLPAINAVFSPSEAELEWAAALIARADDHAVRGSGAFLDDDGSMVDEAVVRRARRLIDESNKGHRRTNEP